MTLDTETYERYMLRTEARAAEISIAKIEIKEIQGQIKAIQKVASILKAEQIDFLIKVDDIEHQIENRKKMIENRKILIEDLKNDVRDSKSIVKFIEKHKK